MGKRTHGADPGPNIFSLHFETSVLHARFRPKPTFPDRPAPELPLSPGSQGDACAHRPVGVREMSGARGLGSVGLLDCHRMTREPPLLNCDPFKGKNCALSFLFTHTHTDTGWHSRCPFELKFWSLWGPIMYMISCPTLWRLRVDQANTARRSNRSILKEINPAYSSEVLMLKLKLQYLGRLMRRTKTQTLMLGKIEGRRRRGGGRG